MSAKWIFIAVNLHKYKNGSWSFDLLSYCLSLSLLLSQSNEIPLISPELLVCRLHHSHHSSLAPVLLCLFSRPLCLFYLHVPLLKHSSAEQQRRTSPFSSVQKIGEEEEAM